MLTAKLKIKNRLGLHARAAAQLILITNKYKSKITISKDGNIADGKSIMAVLTLAAEMGSFIEITVDGEDEKELLEEVTKLIDNKFYEEK